jgi:hypothetical protein
VQRRRKEAALHSEEEEEHKGGGPASRRSSTRRMQEDGSSSSPSLQEYIEEVAVMHRSNMGAVEHDTLMMHDNWPGTGSVQWLVVLAWAIITIAIQCLRP